MGIHVLQLGPYPPPEGGVTRNMLAIRDELKRRGHRCSIAATTRTLNPDPESDVHHPRSGVEMIRLLRALDYDVLHLHLGGLITKRVLALALAVTVFSRRRSVLTVHSGAYPLTVEAKKARPGSIRGWIFRRFGKIVAVNDALVDVFERYGVASQKIEKILPFTLSMPDSSVAPSEEFTAFLGSHSPALLAVGGLEPDYDPLFLTSSMDRIRKEFPNAGLMIIGGGTMRAEVEATQEASASADHIVLAGDVPHAVTLHLIQRSDVFLRTTLFDGDAISVREALFLGKPVIATDTGMRPEGTVLIKSGDTEGLVKALSRAVSGPPWTSLSKVGGSDNVAKILALYDGLI